MAEKDATMFASVSNNEAFAVGRTVPMKLFASWEIEKTSANCVPRLCMFTVTNLKIVGNLDDDINAVILAVQMEGSKRVLRSGDIKLPGGSTSPDIALDLSFSLQYAHFLKRDANNMQVILQRRKKYKNRTMLGYKSLAVGVVDLSKVLQSPADCCLSLVECQRKEHRTVGKPTVALLSIQHITSKPVAISDDLGGSRKPALSGTEHSPESEEEDGSGDGDAENDDISDEEMAGQTTRRRNLKQRFIAMLRRFKTADDGEDMTTHDVRNQRSLDRLFDELENLSDDSDAADVDNLSVLSVPKPRLRPYFKDACTGDTANWSEGEGIASDAATTAVACEPAGSGFTSVAGSVFGAGGAVVLRALDGSSQSHPDSPSSAAAVSGRSPATVRHPKVGGEKVGAVLEGKPSSKEMATLMTESAMDKAMSHSTSPDWASLVEKAFCSSDDRLPPIVLLLDERSDLPYRAIAQHLLLSLQHDYARHAVQASSEADIGNFIAAAASAIQKHCNNTPRLQSVVKVVLFGDDSFFNLVLRSFVKVFSERSPDWLNYIRFIAVPLSSNSHLCRYIGTVDSQYFASFCDGVWTECLDRCLGQSFIFDDASEMLVPLKQYMTAASAALLFPISEAMIARHSDSHKGEKESQVFVPFLTEVKIGSLLTTHSQTDCEEIPVQMLSISPARDGSMATAAGVAAAVPVASSPIGGSGSDRTELQLDYWLTAAPPPAATKSEGSEQQPSTQQQQAQGLQQAQPQAQFQRSDKKSSSGGASGGGRVTLKSCFKLVQVLRGVSRAAVATTFSIYTLSKEKKKIIRLGKKSKDKEERDKSASKGVSVDGVSRIVCTSKDQSDTLTVTVDGIEWKNIHFFQLSTQWQTHIKFFPLAITRQTVEA